jgi:hypothetical protein
MVEYY